MPGLETYEQRAYQSLLIKERQYERTITAALRQSLDEVRVKMSKIYERHAVDGKLSLAEMTQYNRLMTMEKNIVASMDEATRKTLRTIDKLRPELYDEAFFRYAWAIDQDAGVSIAWGVLNRDEILESLASSYYRISRQTYGPEARATVRRAINQGLAQGKSYPQMMKDVKRAFGITNYKAMRIVRTEGQAAVNAGQNDLYLRAQDKGIEGDVVWLSVLDNRTRPTNKYQTANHRVMDGQRKVDGFFTMNDGQRTPYPAWQGLSAGQRIHCRCTQRFEIAEYPPVVRRTRAQGVIPYTTYDNWRPNLNAWGKYVPK